MGVARPQVLAFHQSDAAIANEHIQYDLSVHLFTNNMTACQWQMASFEQHPFWASLVDVASHGDNVVDILWVRHINTSSFQKKFCFWQVWR